MCHRMQKMTIDVTESFDTIINRDYDAIVVVTISIDIFLETLIKFVLTRADSSRPAWLAIACSVSLLFLDTFLCIARRTDI